MLNPDSCGIEVSAKTLLVRLRRKGILEAVREYPNTVAGHRGVLRYLVKAGRSVRVCMEATGTYGLDLALRLSVEPGVELGVLNPRASRRFAEALQVRSKTDLLDVDVLEQHALRMPMERWRPPSPQALELRALARRLTTNTRRTTAEANRLHAAQATQSTPAAVLEDLEASLEQIRSSRQTLLKAAHQAIEQDPELLRRYRLLLSVKGIGALSAILILGELCVLADDLTAPQWVAFAGLDPRHNQSGTSVDRKACLSKAGNAYLRYALYMPALVASQSEPACQHFYEGLVARGKLKLQALCALMRKLLHALHAMIHNNEPFDPDKLFARPAKAAGDANPTEAEANHEPALTSREEYPLPPEERAARPLLHTSTPQRPTHLPRETEDSQRILAT